MDDKIALAVICILLAALVRHRLTKDRDREKVLRDASAKFRAEFSQDIIELSKSDACFVMSKSRTKHDAAITEFRHYVGSLKLKRFDAASKTFRQVRDKLQPGLLIHSMAEDVNGDAETVRRTCDRDEEEMLCAIKGLLSFADKI